MRLIPAVDLKNGKCVRLWQGDFEKTTEYSDDPVAVATQFANLAVSDLHLVDLDGARSGEQQNAALIRAIARSCALTIQLGGGIRNAATVETWLTAGVTRCVIGSLAITEPDTVKSWIARFGGDRIVLALDVRLDEQNEPFVTTHGWTRDSSSTLFECIEDYQTVGLQHVLCTDISRDGAMAGPNFALYERLLRAYPQLQLQASGGVRGLADLQRLRDLGVPAAISGRALLDGKISPAEIEQFQRNA